MTKKTGLGRGLDALIPAGEFAPESPSASPTSGYDTLPIESISRNPRQPRSQIDQEELAELAASIKENGILVAPDRIAIWRAGSIYADCR